MPPFVVPGTSVSYATLQIPHPQYLHVHTLSSFFRLRLLPSCFTSKHFSVSTHSSRNWSTLLFTNRFLPLCFFVLLFFALGVGLPWGGAGKIILFVVCFCHFNSTSRVRGAKCMCLFPNIDPLSNQALHLTLSAIALPRSLSLITSSSFRSHDLALHDPLS